MSHVHRAGDVFVRYDSLELVDRRRGSERPYAKSVEEVRHEADGGFEEGRSDDWSVRFCRALTSAADLPYPANQEHQADGDQGNEEQRARAGHGWLPGWVDLRSAECTTPRPTSPSRDRGQLERTALPPFRPTAFRHIRSGASIPNRSNVNSSTRTQHADSASQEACRAASRSLKMWCSW